MLNRKIILIAVIVVGFAACKSAQTHLNSGNYSRAIHKSIKKLRKKPDKQKFILVLEEAYKKANERDRERIIYLKKESSPDNWIEIFNIYSAMKYRQEMIKPLLPLHLPSKGRKADFEIIDYDEEIIAAKKRAADYLYTHAMQLLEDNDRTKARDAYYELIQVKEYYANFRDVDDQINRAKFLGTNKVLFKMENITGIPLPADFDKELKKLSLYELDKKWLEFHTNPDSNVFYDYLVRVNIDRIDVGPDELKEIHYEESKEVEDGWEYVLDEDGNVMKDSSGNDIKVKKYTTIKAYVVETRQRKIATLSGSVDFYDNRNRQLLRTFPVTSDAVFEHFSAVANGDLKALKPETKEKLRRKVIPFPHDLDLLAQAGASLKPMVKGAIWDHSGILRE